VSGGGVNQISVERAVSCCLINTLTSPLIDPLDVRNIIIKTTDISQSYNLDTFKTRLPTKFTQLPSLTTGKINFAANAENSTVLDTLHIYDNAESFAALLVADMYLCSDNTDYVNNGINLFHIGNNIKNDPNDRAEFDTTIQQFGNLTQGEIVGDIFVGSKQNFSNT
jgi:hypothetical protein